MSTVVLEESLRERRNVRLPDGWVHADLGSLGAWGSGGTPSKSNSSYWTDGSIPWVSPKDMKVDVINSSLENITKNALATNRLHLLPPRTIIFVVRGMILAHSFPVALTACPVVINQDMRSLIPLKGIDPAYLYWALRSETQHILTIVRDSTHGTRRIESDALKLWPVPLAPYCEQVRIVERIQRIRETIEGASLKLRRLARIFGFETTSRRQSPLLHAVLSKAFAGELVETEAEIAHREGRDYEPASMLLERIAVERVAAENGKPKRANNRRKKQTTTE
jgi:type I restriction enzyme, S subunit